MAKVYDSEMPEKPSTFDESIDRGVKRLIEVNKTYRFPREGGGTDLYRVRSVDGDTLLIEDMSTKKTRRTSRSGFQKKLNEGEIYVSADLVIEALRRLT